MINRIVSFYMKFMEFANGSFHKFHNEMTTGVRSSIYDDSDLPT